MGLEAATYVNDLTTTNPVSTDKRKQGDDHLRLIKTVLKSTFPNADKPFYFKDYEAITGAETVALADMNKVYGASTSGGAFTVTLPTNLGASVDGFMVSVVKLETNGNRVTVAPSSGTINGVASLSITNAGDRIDAYWTGSTWYGVVTLAGVDKVAITGDVTVDASHFDKMLDVAPASANATITLPAVATFLGRTVTVKLNSSTYTCTIEPDAGETIEGASSWVLRAQYDLVTLLAVTGGWMVVNAIGGSMFATAAEFRDNTARKVLTTDKVWDAAGRVALTWSDAGVTAVDLDSGINFTVTTGSDNSTLGAPTNAKTGQSGFIEITQGATPRTLAFNAAWVFDGGSDPGLTASAGAKDVLYYTVLNSTGPVVHGTLRKNVS